MSEPDPYTIERSVPSVATYIELRTASGLSVKTPEAAMRGLAGSLFAVQVLFDGKPVGMGRVIGDGGCFYQVVDIAVLPEHQRRDLGKRIMAEIARYIETEVPRSAHVSLIADGPARDLYAQFGFKVTGPDAVGMVMKL